MVDDNIKEEQDRLRKLKTQLERNLQEVEGNIRDEQRAKKNRRRTGLGWKWK